MKEVKTKIEKLKEEISSIEDNRYKEIFDLSLIHIFVYASKSFKIKDLKERFYSLNLGILNGESISTTLGDTGNYSKYTISIVKLGEEGGSIDERLDSLSSYLEKKLISKINRGISLLQPASVIFMGGFITVSYTHLDVYKRQHKDSITFNSESYQWNKR